MFDVAFEQSKITGCPSIQLMGREVTEIFLRRTCANRWPPKEAEEKKEREAAAKRAGRESSAEHSGLQAGGLCHRRRLKGSTPQALYPRRREG